MLPTFSHLSRNLPKEVQGNVWFNVGNIQPRLLVVSFFNYFLFCFFTQLDTEKLEFHDKMKNAAELYGQILDQVKKIVDCLSIYFKQLISHEYLDFKLANHHKLDLNPRLHYRKSSKCPSASNQPPPQNEKSFISFALVLAFSAHIGTLSSYDRKMHSPSR